MVRLTFIAVVLIANVAYADPIPKRDEDTRYIKRVFGEWIDPDQDCQWIRSGTGVTMMLPESSHTYSFLSAEKNAPRLEREVEGHFRMTVRVQIRFELDPKKKKPRLPRISGTMYVFTDENQALQSLTWRKTNLNSFEPKLEFNTLIDKQPTYQTRFANPKPKKKTYWLRTTRTQNQLLAESSADGIKWYPISTKKFAAGRTVKVGLMAEGDVNHPAEITFDEYEIKAIK
ncbi:MAG: hypothetical protein U0798_04005 [Gemmataceae bacterium]